MSFFTVSIQEPFPGVIFDILPYLVIILLIADHMVVIGTLEYWGADFPVAEPFEGGNKMWDDCIRRGRRLRRPLSRGFVKRKDNMDVIGHDYKFIHRDSRDPIAAQNIFLRNFTHLR